MRRFAGDSVEVITNRPVSTFGIGPHSGHVAVTAANGDFAYLVAPDSLFLRRSATRNTIFLGSGCALIAAITTTGSEVICFDGQNSGGASRYSAGTPPTSILNA